MMSELGGWSEWWQREKATLNLAPMMKAKKNSLRTLVILRGNYFIGLVDMIENGTKIETCELTKCHFSRT